MISRLANITEKKRVFPRLKAFFLSKNKCSDSSPKTNLWVSSPPLLWAEIQIEKDRTGDTGQTPDRQTGDTGQTPDRQTPDRHRTPDELKFDKNAIQKIMKYH